MDLLLRKKYTYTLPGSFEATKTKPREIFGIRSSILLARSSCTVDEEGSFSIRTNFSLFSAVSIGQTIYVKGKIVPAPEGTIVIMTLSPNFVFPLAIYLMLIVSLNVLFGDNSLMGSNNGRSNNLLIIVVMEFILIAFVQIYSFFLRGKFERAINLAKISPADD